MIAKKDTIEKAVEYIKEKVSPDKIYLFGSYAKGNPTKDSDLDFFIIKETKLAKHKRTIPLYSLEKTKKIGFPIGIDFIMYTPQKFENHKNEPNSLAGEVNKTGKLLYVRKDELHNANNCQFS